MLAAARAGCNRLLVGIGGSATNDGGAGMACALGALLLDELGAAIPPGGTGLEHLSSIDMSGWKLPAGLEVVVACDVDNPLTGPTGASAVYGPQKGATSEMVLRLDAGTRALRRSTGIRLRPGSDIRKLQARELQGDLALDCELSAMHNSCPVPRWFWRQYDLIKSLTRCSFIVTGEGILDGQTARGKVVAVVARRALAAGKPCIALAGAIAERADELLAPYGLTTSICIADGPMDLEAAMRNGSRLLANSAERLARLLKTVIV